MYDILTIEIPIIYYSFDTVVCGVVISDNNKRQLLARTRIQMLDDELLAFTEKPIVESRYISNYVPCVISEL